MLNANFNIILESIPYYVALIKPDGTIIQCNKAFLNFLQMPEDSVIGRKCYNVIHNFDKFTEECPLVKALNTNKTQVWQMSLGDKTFFVSVTPVKDEDSGIPFLVHILEDITSIKNKITELEEYKEIYKTIVENAGEGIVITQGDRIIFANPKILEISGYTLDEAVSKPFIDFIYPEDRPRILEFYLRLISGEKGLPDRYQLRIIHKNGSLIWIETNTVTIIWEGNISVLHFIRDISGIKKAEEEKAQLLTQLIQLQKMEAIGRFASGIIHDFNNILTPIKGFTQLSLHRILEYEITKKYLENILSAVEKGESLIKQLLVFCRKQAPELKVININEIIKTNEELLKRLLGMDILLVKNLSSDLFAIKADPTQIFQIILNIAANARDAMPLGGQFIIETSNVIIDQEFQTKYEFHRTGPYVMISFTDTGKGLGSEILDKAFNAFFTTKIQGTGLGLSIVYEIVKNHKGNILVSSEIGQGTTFKVYLPAIEEEIEKQTIESKDKEILKGSETIMIIDDDENIRQLISEMLKKLQYKTIEATTPDMALLLAQFYNDKIDLIIMDLVLQGINGVKLFNKIKKYRRDIKVLYISAHPNEIINNYGIKDRDSNFLQKPFSIETLSKKLREVLNNIKQ